MPTFAQKCGSHGPRTNAGILSRIVGASAEVGRQVACGPSSKRNDHKTGMKRKCSAGVLLCYVFWMALPV